MGTTGSLKKENKTLNKERTFLWTRKCNLIYILLLLWAAQQVVNLHENTLYCISIISLFSFKDIICTNSYLLWSVLYNAFLKKSKKKEKLQFLHYKYLLHRWIFIDSQTRNDKVGFFSRFQILTYVQQL